jgi:hypothetical protein
VFFPVADCRLCVNCLEASGTPPRVDRGRSVTAWHDQAMPATTLLEVDDLRDRLERGQVKVVATDATLTERFTGLGSG